MVDEKISEKIGDLVQKVASLSLLEAVQFRDELQKSLGIPDAALFAAPAAVQTSAPGAAESSPESAKEIFDIFITKIQEDKKLNIIKVVRELSNTYGYGNIGIKDAKDMVTSVLDNPGKPPKLFADLPKDKVDDCISALKKAGADAEAK